MTTRPNVAEARSLALVGLDAHLIHIEAKVSQGPSSLELIGLSEAQMRESRVRIRAGLQHIGVPLNDYSITVTLTPSDLPKSGPLDLAMAVAVLGAIGHVSVEALQDTVILGELSLMGGVRPVRGVLPSLRAAVKQGITKAIVPRDNANEAAFVSGIRVLVASHIREIVRHLRDGETLDSVGEPPQPELTSAIPDMSDVRGMHSARRAMEIAAAGGHHLLLVGQPGAGKTLLARRLPGILPPLTHEEALDVTAIHSVAGLLSPERGFIQLRPFRAPHHTVSAAGLVGGGDPARPGEVSLAHHGVLFLDELVEFRAAVLDSLRQPLEEGRATIFRARRQTTFPARPLIVGATNPCPCGFAGDRSGRCTCSPERVKSYQSRLTSRFLNHFDIQIALPPIDVQELQRSTKGETSSEMQKRVVAARALQIERAQTTGAARTNAQLSMPDLQRVASPDASGLKLLAQAVERLKFSAADHAKVLHVARTIADLDGSTTVRGPHIAEAVHAILFPSASSTGTEA